MGISQLRVRGTWGVGLTGLDLEGSKERASEESDGEDDQCGEGAA